MLKTRLFALLLATTLTAAFAADPIVARVGTQEIKSSQIAPYLSGISEQEKQTLVENPTALSQAVRTLLLQQMLLKEATAAGWDKNPDLQGRLARIRDAAISESYLEKITKVQDGYPSDADVKALYDARIDELRIPKQYQVAQIFISKADPAKAKTKLEIVQKNLKSRDFAVLAKENSDEPRSAANGGLVGWLAEETIQPAIRKAVTALAKGSTVGPIELADGNYFVKVIDIKEPRTATLEEVKPQLVRVLREEREKLNRQTYINQLQTQSPIVLDEITLPELLQPETKK
jgi:peptidylprolyl isomerase